MVNLEETNHFSEEGSLSSEMDVFSSSESKMKEEYSLLWKDQRDITSYLERNDGDNSLQGRSRGLV